MENVLGIVLSSCFLTTVLTITNPQTSNSSSFIRFVDQKSQSSSKPLLFIVVTAAANLSSNVSETKRNVLPWTRNVMEPLIARMAQTRQPVTRGKNLVS